VVRKADAAEGSASDFWLTLNRTNRPRVPIRMNTASTTRPTTAPQSESAVVLANHWIQPDGDARTGRGPDKLDQCGHDDAIVGSRQLLQVVVTIEGRPERDHAQDARDAADDQEDTYRDRVASV
jgi:hypothetical protein